MNKISRKSYADSLITYLGMETGQIDLAFDEEGHCQLDGNEEQLIELWYAEGEDAASIYISTAVGSLFDGDRTFILAEAMRANLYWRGTNGATISLGPEDEIVLHTEIPVEDKLDMNGLRETISSLFETARVWSQYLEDHQPEVEPIAV